MFGFFRRFFRKKNPVMPPDAAAEELWQTDFRREKDRRFAEESTDSYTASFSAAYGKTGGYTLTLLRKNLFAWTVDPLYEYKDMVLEAVIDFGNTGGREALSSPHQSVLKAGTCAFGFLLRYTNDHNYYSVLLSDRGYVRIDVVFNGNPIAVIGWTQIPDTPDIPGEPDAELPPYKENPSVYSLRIIMRGTEITVIVNDKWTAYTEDDTIQSYGKIAFAGQNWGTSKKASAVLRAIAAESRPMEIEALHYRWNTYLHIDPQARINLAESYCAIGKYVPAVIELKKAWKETAPSVPSLLLAVKAYLAQQMYEEAEEKIKAVLDAEPGNGTAAEEYASLLYLQERLDELERFLDGAGDIRTQSPLISNIEGHLHFRKNRWEQSAEAYGRAVQADPSQGLYFVNRSKAFHAAGKKREAQKDRLEAARLFLGAQQYGDMETIIPLLIENLDDSAPVEERKAVFSITGKYYYAAEEFDKALPLFEKLTELGTDDSAVWYLAGITYGSRNERGRAVTALRKAVELENDFPLYRLRLAENLFLAGEDPGEELAEALRLGADDGWAWNLAAQIALEKNEYEKAEHAIRKALELLPDELDVLKNFAEIKRRQGRLDEVLPLFDTSGDRHLSQNAETPKPATAALEDRAGAFHAGANLLAADGRYDDADEWYAAALRLQSRNPAILTDRAAACIESEYLNEADTLLTQALDIAPSVRIYQMLGYVAGRKGEYARAEIVYRTGLENFPADGELLYGLAGLYLFMKRFDTAQQAAEKLARHEKSARVDSLLKEIRDVTSRGITCSSCGREWYVPLSLPAQQPLRLVAEPPDDMPAGNCVSCGTVYCIACAKKGLGADGRFRCPKCKKPLKLADPGLQWLLSQWSQNAHR